MPSMKKIEDCQSEVVSIVCKPSLEKSLVACAPPPPPRPRSAKRAAPGALGRALGQEL